MYRRGINRLNMLKIYNSLTGKKEEFKPQAPGKVKMYTCGVTVYDECHIGHARSLYVFEVIRRYLKYKGYKVEFVRNITDIDDKIINRARELNIGWKELIDKHINNYYKNLESLGIEKADKEPRATENIKEMVRYIKALIDKGYAYVTKSGVYFSVRKFKDYGKLSGQSIDQIQDGVRIKSDETKADPLDFALWKKAKQAEPSWPSPWGAGRPGWHIECSVMSQKFLNTKTLDIHGGGRDLIFPHHENERAQAQALTGKSFANYWIHHGLLTINSQKMAKSQGNFITIDDAVNRYSADILKIFYLQAHHSSAIDFSDERMEEAKKAYERISVLKEKLEGLFQGGDIRGKSKSGEPIALFEDDFIKAMDDDFNMPRGLAVLFDLATACNKLLEESESNKKDLFAGYKVLSRIIDIFGLIFPKKISKEISSLEIEEKISQRLLCKKQKDFKEADRIRKELAKKGIILEDAKEGTTWRVKL